MTGVLTIMGSGETAPTMIRTHRRLLEGFEAPRAVLLDTPYGFQENADDITARAQRYFAESVGTPIAATSWRDDDPLAEATALAAIADADYVFAGPGSPTFALERWRSSPLVPTLRDVLDRGGAVTFASAAALTVGRHAIPVYEIYKAGHPPAWAAGLDLMAGLGLDVVIVPHYDNAEGGHHDTRFCYLGERRLAALEADLDESTWVLGVDEHTALVLDLGAGRARVEGNGTVTLRHRGTSTVLPAGTEVTIDRLHPSRIGDADAIGTQAAEPAPVAADGPVLEDTTSVGAPPGLATDTDRCRSAFDDAIGDADPAGAVAAMLELEEAIVAWSADTLQSDDTDRARRELRRMIVRLGEVAVAGAADPRERIAPFVDAVLAARVAAREARAYDLADRLRDALGAAGVELRDSATGTEWVLGESPPR